jgi:hypothetical protein
MRDIPSAVPKSFWIDRIDRLTDRGDATPPERCESTVESLLTAVVTRSRAGDRAGLRDTLAAAPAATGLALAPLAADLLRTTMSADFAADRRAALARIGDLLPGLDAVTPLEILARAARRPVPPRDPEADGPAHPVDPAVAGPVLLAGLVTEDELVRALDARARTSHARANASDARTRASDARTHASDAEARASDAEARASDAEARASDARARA